MPARFCICTGCAGCAGCGTDSRCGKLFDRELTGKMRCPLCQPVVDRQRNARPNTTARGYGSQHQAERASRAAVFVPGQPCARCGQPIASMDDADLGHADGQQGYRGLEHSWCNRGASRRGKR